MMRYENGATAIGLADYGADVVPTGGRETHLDEVCRAVEATGKITILQMGLSKGAGFITRKAVAVDGGYLASGVNS